MSSVSENRTAEELVGKVRDLLINSGEGVSAPTALAVDITTAIAQALGCESVDQLARTAALLKWFAQDALQNVDEVCEEITALRAKAARMEEALTRMSEAADPFVRATLLQAPLHLPDSLGVRDAFPGTWPDMRDARMLVFATEKARASLSEGTERKDQPTEEL